MIELLYIALASLLVIAGATALGNRLGLASPLVLVAVGVAASFLPMFASVHIEPELILEGVLPPLLYSAAVSMPAMNFRREFGAISGLSVFLVVASSLLLGLFFMLVLPDLGFAWGVALGAIVSPTDAVATSIIKRTSVSKRVVAILDGESLLNDASALVILRTAIAATAAAFSFWDAVGAFVYSVAVALVIGVVVGRLNLVIRSRVSDPTVNTVISFTVPFLAAMPAELLEASGLVAAVVAGLITGIRAPRELSPQHRLSDQQNWHMVELVLEGAVFLTMGLQIRSIVMSVHAEHAGLGPAIAIALGALVLTILVRAAYVAPLLGFLSHKAKRGAAVKERFKDFRERAITSEEAKQRLADLYTGAAPPDPSRSRAVSRFVRAFADIDYFLRAPLGWREGVAVVWAGMRGAVTVAAAHTLPTDTPQRAVLILIAYVVAAVSLVLQGGTIGPLLRAIEKKDVDTTAADAQTDEARTRIMRLMRASAESIPEPEKAKERTPEGFQASRAHRLAVIAAQRTALLNARDNGTFDADLLADILANLDADQIAIELRSVAE
ncbi:MAG: sodium:proton antiporter [Arachnia sp.]